MNRLSRLCLSLLVFLFLLSCGTKEEPIKLLILSGSNNHEWQSTTPFLAKIFTESGKFSVAITEKPDTLKANDLKVYGAIVSNWNSWPNNDLRWPAETENALLSFVENGGGWVTFHASTSAFYKWPEFRDISTAAWIDSTWHGEISTVEVQISNNEHPVTKGLSNFTILDELWVNAARNETFQILGTSTNADIAAKGIENQPSIMVSHFGKGKIFHTTLGHNVQTMENKAFQTLILRGTEWAATGKVTQLVPLELQKKSNQ